METKAKTINTYPKGTPSGTDRLPYFDAGGTIRYTQYSDFQENTPPPELWRNFILDEVKISYVQGTFPRTAPVDKFSDVRDTALGIAIPEYGRIIYPEIVRRPWGTKAAACTPSISESELFSSIPCGKTNTTLAYSARAENRGNNCAIGYAHNFSKFVNDGSATKGIPAGEWYVPSPQEMEMVVWPRFNKLAYVASLMGYEWPTNAGYWTCTDGEERNAVRFYPASIGNLVHDNKENNFCVMLMAMIPFRVTTLS